MLLERLRRAEITIFGLHFALIGLAFVLNTIQSHAELYVAPDGDDSGPGTAERPFVTLARARDALRKNPSESSNRIVVRGGKYFGVSLVLGSQDSGLTIDAAPGERPILYGGILIKNWVKEGDFFYSAALPDTNFRPGGQNADGSAKLPIRVRMITIDEKMAAKARYPAQGTLTNLNEFKVPWMSTSAGGFQRKPTQDEVTTMSYNPGDILASMQIANAELTIYHLWDESSVGVASNDIAHHILKLAPPASYPPGAFNVQRYVIWNTAEGMTSPGHWFHDRSRNRLVYWPLSGQNMNRAEVIVPVSMTIIRETGTTENPIKNVCLKGLTLSVTNTPMVSPGFAAENFDGAISLDHAENCSIERLTIQRVGGHAINSLSSGVRLQVNNCEIAECGAGGIYVSGSAATITNNHIHNIGIQYSSSIGIFRGGNNCILSHNEIHGTPYSGIAFGGHDNVIEANLIYDCMKTLHDGAAIYLSGAKRCTIRGNLTHNLGDATGAKASSFYLDEQCEDCVVEKNTSFNVSVAVQNHMARNNTIRNNVFTAIGDATLGFTGCSGYTLEKNVVYAGGSISIINIDAIKSWSKNLFYSRKGVIQGTQTDKTNPKTVPGVKADTVKSDPLFQNLEAGDLRYKFASPTFHQGIQALDMSHAGRQPQ